MVSDLGPISDMYYASQWNNLLTKLKLVNVFLYTETNLTSLNVYCMSSILKLNYKGFFWIQEQASSKNIIQVINLI